MRKTYILGISCFYHDAAACLVTDGEVVAAAEEERFSRRKHDPSFPSRAAAFCLERAGIGAGRLDHVVFYEKPFLKFERIAESFLAAAPRSLRTFLDAAPVWAKEKLFLPGIVARETGYPGRCLFTSHHEAHAAAAFYPSPFPEAAILTMDGVGEWATASWGAGRGGGIEIGGELRFPHSPGLLYSAFTRYLGFEVNSGEYKVMGLAPYGEPAYADRILRELLDLREDGSFRMNMEFFDYVSGIGMTGERFDRLFGGPPRKPEGPILQRHMDLARSIQEVTGEIVLRMARHVRRETGSRNLCMAGGVALNCVANGLLLRERVFDEVWVQPAAGDSGGALGAALLAWHRRLRMPRPRGARDAMKGSRLGPEYGDAEIASLLERRGIPSRRLSREELPEAVSRLLADGKVVGWFQGRMEFGPRALGSRSILADPRIAGMRSRINETVKFRESFRPFAPAVLREHAGEWFEMDVGSPYMLFTFPVRAEKRVPSPDDRSAGISRLDVFRSAVPAVTHVDFSSRVQTVSREDDPLFHDLVEAFRRRTGCPMLLNTSFNTRGEPIVCAPEEAIDCFLRTDIDFLALGPFLLDKREVPPEMRGGGSGAAAAEGSTAPHPKETLRTAALLAAGSGAVAVLQYRLGRPKAAAALALAGLLAAALTLLFPRPAKRIRGSALRLLRAALRKAVRFLLAAGFLLAVTPAAVLSRRLGRASPVLAARNAATGGYWEKRPSADWDPARYERMY